MSIHGAVFHLRNQTPHTGQFSPATLGGITSIVELFVDDPYSFVSKVIAASAHELNPVKDYEETGYREGNIVDPFRWSILKKISD